jgi:monoamine oxidase
MERIGGRACTDSLTFGFPWDLGCHWLHSAETNPFVPIADTCGFTYRTGPVTHRLWTGKDWALPELEAEAEQFLTSNLERLHAVGAGGSDLRASDCLELESSWTPLLRTVLSGEWSVDLPSISSVDTARYEDGGVNWPVVDGYGALVARHAAGIPVSLSTPVRRIEWGGARVRLHTSQGVVDAATALVTVSVGVLQAGLIAFDPPLPGWKLDAFDSVQLGNANKVAFGIDRRLLDVDGYTVIHAPVGERQGMWLRPGVFGRDQIDCFVAGSLGAALEAEGSAAMVAVGRELVREIWGASVERQISVTACSTWQREPWIRGAYAAARPGLAHRRPDLATPLDGRLFFAGEATSPTAYSTCHGAHESGFEAITAISQAAQASARS